MAPLLLALLLLVAVFYFLFAYPLYVIARNTGTPCPWRAWIPIWNSFLLLDLSGISYWFLLVPLAEVFIHVGPFGLALQLGTFALFVGVWARIASKLGRSPWLALLIIIPLVDIIFLFYLAAVSKGETPAPGGSGSPAPAPTPAAWKHPELLPNEAFVGNYTEHDFENCVRWASKRLGTAAYDNNGMPLNDPSLHPVFASVEELQEAGLTV